MEWISIKDRLPENGVVVQVLQGRSRVITNLKRQNRLWFLPDGSMYVYYEPTHWMSLTNEIKDQSTSNELNDTETIL